MDDLRGDNVYPERPEPLKSPLSHKELFDLAKTSLLDSLVKHDQAIVLLTQLSLEASSEEFNAAVASVNEAAAHLKAFGEAFIHIRTELSGKDESSA